MCYVSYNINIKFLDEKNHGQTLLNGKINIVIGMTITLKQVGQINDVMAFSDYDSSLQMTAVVLNPTLPAVIFNYTNVVNNVQTALVVDNTAQQVLFPNQTTNPKIYVYNAPVFFLGNVIMTGGQEITDMVPWFGAYDLQTNVFVYNSIPISGLTGNVTLLDIVINYDNQGAYFFNYIVDTFTIALFLIPFEGLLVLFDSLQFPSSYQVALLVVPTLSCNSAYALTGIVLSNNTFYVPVLQCDYTFGIWVFSITEIPFQPNIPFTTSTPGNLYQINIQYPVSYGFLSLHNSINNGSLISNIIIVVYTNPGIYIISFDTTTNIATNLYQSSNANVPTPPVYSSGLVIFPIEVGASSYNIAVYDVRTNTYEESQTLYYIPPPYVSVGGYVVVLSGAINSMTITIYQVLTDSSLIITNMKFSNNTLTGTVVNVNGNTPMSGVTIYLINLQTQGGFYIYGSVITSTTTDNNGNFTFSISQTGFYAVSIL